MSDDDGVPVHEECYASEVARDEHLARGQPFDNKGDGGEESQSSLDRKPTISSPNRYVSPRGRRIA
jgi:hypothetical protein